MIGISVIIYGICGSVVKQIPRIIIGVPLLLGGFIGMITNKEN